ncbi:MAG: hypothetical protein Q8Q84_07285 [Hydrogenophaga sp.]|nr:hypothetical protein [Hydrogenophaga sp.]
MPAERHTRQPRPHRTACTGLWIALSLGGCSAVPPAVAPVSPAAVPAPPAAVMRTPSSTTAAAPAPEPLRTVPAPAPRTALSATDTPPLDALLAYAERARSLSATELSADIVSLDEPAPTPLRQMRLAIALMHTQLPVDTARALGLLQRVINNPAPESTALKPLARLLATRLGTQRRLEDTVERQGQQLRDNQRRIEQLSERLEAMRAIERSLTTRPKARPVPTP